MANVGDRIHVGSCFAEIFRLWEKPADRALYVGLSGGMGAGKSSVASVWKSLGAHVFSADDLAREVVAVGTPGLAEVVAYFGPEVLGRDGNLNRAALGAAVFGSPEHRIALERITHPRIAQRAQELRNQAEPRDIVVYDVPLLVEADLADQFDCVAMVDAPTEVRIARLKDRGVPADVALARIAAQVQAPQRQLVANIWMENLGTSSEMSEVASRVFEAWLS